MSLSDITVIVPTFHRRGYLRDCLKGLEDNLPECLTVVVSDDDIEPELRGYVTWQELPYDSGHSAKRNAGVELVVTPYTLIGADDFDYSTPEARKSVIEMALVLKYNKNIDMVVGRHNNRDYHGFLEYVPGEYIKEHRLDIKRCLPTILKPFVLWKIDIGPVFFLARTETLREVPWDASIGPIGGEHVDFFLDLKAAGKLVVYLPSANVNELPHDPTKQDPRYPAFRRRCWDGHALMMKKRGIKNYYGFDEVVK